MNVVCLSYECIVVCVPRLCAVCVCWVLGVCWVWCVVLYGVCSLWPHGLQHARLPCPSPFPRACLNSWPLSWQCHPTILSSVVPFSFSFQSFPASGSFLMSQFFTSDGQNIGASVSASVLPMNIHGWFPLGWTGLISLQSKGLSRVSTPQFKSINSALSLLYGTSWSGERKTGLGVRYKFKSSFCYFIHSLELQASILTVRLLLWLNTIRWIFLQNMYQAI